MTLGIKILTSTLGVIGAGGVIAPLTLWQTGYIGNASSGGVTPFIQADSPSANSSLSPTSSSTETTALDSSFPAKAKRETSENCQVIEKTAWKEVFSGLSINNQEGYTVITCNKTDKVLKDKWTGFFPNGVFDEENYEIGEEFTMETTTVLNPHDSHEQYKTTFLSDALDDRVLDGDWGSEKKSIEGKGLSAFMVTGKDIDGYGPIYLVLSEKIEKI